MAPSTLTATQLVTQADVSRSPSELHQACVTITIGSDRFSSPWLLCVTLLQ